MYPGVAVLFFSRRRFINFKADLQFVVPRAKKWRCRVGWGMFGSCFPAVTRLWEADRLV